MAEFCGSSSNGEELLSYGSVKTQGFLGGTGGWQKTAKVGQRMFGVGPGSLNEKVSGKVSKQRAEQLERGRRGASRPEGWWRGGD